jgi:Zn-finger nucleic acid-binding protein
MKCPKDGHDMEQAEFHGVTVERCLHCQGIFLDADEIAALVAQDDVTLLGRVVRDISAALRGAKPESK